MERCRSRHMCRTCRKYRIGFGISLISLSVPEIYSTSGSQSAILIYGSRTTSSHVGAVVNYLAMSWIHNRLWNFDDISFRSGDIFYFRFTVGHFDFRKPDDIVRCRSCSQLFGRVVNTQSALEFRWYLLPFRRCILLPVYRRPFYFRKSDDIERCRSSNHLFGRVVSREQALEFRWYLFPLKRYILLPVHSRPFWFTEVGWHQAMSEL